MIKGRMPVLFPAIFWVPAAISAYLAVFKPFLALCSAYCRDRSSLTAERSLVASFGLPVHEEVLPALDMCGCHDNLHSLLCV